MLKMHRRHGVYYAILSVPLDLQNAIGKKQVWRSTGLRRYAAAKTAVKQWAAVWEQICVSVRFGMIPAEIVDELLARYALGVLKLDETYKDAITGDAETRAKSLYKNGMPLTDDADEKLSYELLIDPDNLNTEIESLKGVIASDKRVSIRPTGDAVKMLADTLLRSRKIKLDETSQDYSKFLRDVNQTKIAINQIRVERLSGEYSTEYQDRQEKTWKAAVPVPVDKGMPVNELIPLFMAYLHDTGRDKESDKHYLAKKQTALQRTA